MTDQNGEAYQESESPILFARISDSYSRAIHILWTAEFADKHPFHWDKSLIFHPLSHLLGVGLEAAIKGLLACRGVKVPRTHNLEKLLSTLNDNNVEERFSNCLQDLSVPQELFESNKDKPREEIEAMYRRHHIHVHLLNRLYDRPYATRYPVLGGHALPDSIAIQRITQTAQQVLSDEIRNWRP